MHKKSIQPPWEICASCCCLQLISTPERVLEPVIKGIIRFQQTLRYANNLQESAGEHIILRAALCYMEARADHALTGTRMPATAIHDNNRLT